jgi:hypothetical protein
MKKIPLFLLFIFCSNRCAPEATIIHFFNKSEKNVILLSKSELQDYRNRFLSKTLVSVRTIKNNDDRYLGFVTNELDNFKNNDGNYFFYIVNSIDVDSIVVKKNRIKLLQENNTIIYNPKEILFLNKE